VSGRFILDSKHQSPEIISGAWSFQGGNCFRNSGNNVLWEQAARVVDWSWEICQNRMKLTTNIDSRRSEQQPKDEHNSYSTEQTPSQTQQCKIVSKEE
jgi:hypothetical protein